MNQRCATWPARVSQWLVLATVVLLLGIFLVGMSQTKPADVLQELRDIKTDIESQVQPKDVLAKVEQIETRLDEIQSQLVAQGVINPEEHDQLPPVTR